MKKWTIYDGVREAACSACLFVGFLCFLVLLYPLSAGPAFLLCNDGSFVGYWLYLKTYWPIVEFSRDHPTFGAAWDWYMSWWGSRGRADLSF
jgi:hypothetical protein